MTVLNITTRVEKAIAKQWLEWAKNYCAQCYNISFPIKECRLFLLNLEDDEPTYVLQLYFENDEAYENYTGSFANIFHAEQQNLFGTQHVSFETVMRQLN